MGLLVTVPPTVAVATQESGTASDPCSFPTSLVRTRPQSDGKAVRVKVGVTLIDVVEVNDVAESFKVDLVLQLEWHDPRLSTAARGASLAECRPDLKEIWNPELSLINRRQPITAQEPDLDIAADGTVRLSQRIFAELSSPLDLRTFPFDVQHLPIQAASYTYGQQDVRFVVDATKTGRLERDSLQGWDIVSNTSEVGLPVLSGALGEHTRLDHTIVVAREPGYYVWSVVIPLCLIILMAWSVFWISPQAHDAQIGLATAAVFSLITFLLSLRQLLPRVAYLTRADQLVLAAMALVFLALAEVIVTTRLSMQNQDALAHRIDRYTRWGYLVIFVGLVYVILFV